MKDAKERDERGDEHPRNAHRRIRVVEVNAPAERGPEEPRISYIDLRLDPYAPHEMADRAQTVGIAKANLDFLSTFSLAILAGAFIGLGTEFATVVATATGLGYGLNRFAIGVAFSLGLVLTLVAGAELFTGNTLIVMTWMGHKITLRQMLRNWVIVYLGNLAGSIVTVLLVYYSGQWSLDGNQVGATAVTIANGKVQLGFWEALIRGILANALVCLAVWLTFSARTTFDKIAAITFPIAAFVASSFEHSVANMYFIPMGILLSGNGPVLEAAGLTTEQVANLTWSSFFWANLVPVTIGNIIGGAVLVGAFYWLIYLRTTTVFDLARMFSFHPVPGHRPDDKPR
ncbi:MAG: formate/nitrite transporter family protein [Chloroflexi bacterium]|nr:formate/nitrite transporter family protein [Chloroflexota bacterium]